MVLQRSSSYVVPLANFSLEEPAPLRHVVRLQEDSLLFAAGTKVSGGEPGWDMGPAPPRPLLTSIRCPQVWRVNVTGPGCRHFLTCDRCLRAERFMGCGWCGDGCTRSHECNGTWVRDSCLPILTHVGPRRCPWPRGDLLESGQGGWGGRQNTGRCAVGPPLLKPGTVPTRRELPVAIACSRCPSCSSTPRAHRCGAGQG